MMELDFNNIDDLKIFAAFYINEHDCLSESEKDVLYNFVDNANLPQLENLLATGSINKSLTEFRVAPRGTLNQGATWKGMGQGLMGKNYTTGMIDGIASGVAATALVALTTAVAYKLYKNYMSKAAKACKGKSGTEKTNCMVKFKKQGQKEKLRVLQKGLGKCNVSKDPAKCKSKLNLKIAKAKAKMGEL